MLQSCSHSPSEMEERDGNATDGDSGSRQGVGIRFQGAGPPFGLGFLSNNTKRVPHPSRSLRRVGGSADCTIGFAFQAAGARNEIFLQPSFTRTSPASSKR
jgi:hypothetical protein